MCVCITGVYSGHEYPVSIIGQLNDTPTQQGEVFE